MMIENDGYIAQDGHLQLSRSSESFDLNEILKGRT